MTFMSEENKQQPTTPPLPAAPGSAALSPDRQMLRKCFDYLEWFTKGHVYKPDTLQCRGCELKRELMAYLRLPPNDGTQRPGSPDGSLATETRKPGSLK